MLRKAILSLALSTSSLVVIVSSAKADIPCNQIPNPTPGTQCYQRVNVEARHVGYGEGISQGKNSSTSIAGWYITGWNGPVSTSQQGGAATINFIKLGSNFQVIDNVDEYDRNLQNLKTQVQGNDNVLKKIDDALRENQRRRNSFSQAKTNVDRIEINAEASGRCTRNFVGTCVDNAGGWYQGYVDVYMVYVGTPGEIKAEQQSKVSEIQQELARLQQAKNKPQNNDGIPQPAPNQSSLGNSAGGLNSVAAILVTSIFGIFGVFYLLKGKK